MPFAPEPLLQSGTIRLLTHTGGGLLCRPVSLCPGTLPAKRHVSLAHSHERPFAFTWGRGIMHSPPHGTPPAKRRTSPVRMSVFSSGILRSASKVQEQGRFFMHVLLCLVRGKSVIMHYALSEKYLRACFVLLYKNRRICLYAISLTENDLI